MEDKDHWELRYRLIDTLALDAKANFEILRSNSSDLNRRNYVRSLFALYEAALANLRESVADRLVLKSSVNGTYDLYEIYPLMDESATISERGDISKRFNQVPFKNLVKYVVKLACREYQITESVFDNGWNDFQSSIQIRHKITHPKYEGDISVSDEELKILENGRTWWNNTLQKIRIKANKK
jgi:hypothetical protein